MKQHAKLSYKIMKIVELEYDNRKVKSFENEIAINLFTGASGSYGGQFEYLPVDTNLFELIKIKYPEKAFLFKWDNGVDMTAEEWVWCVKEIMSMFF